MKLNGSTLLSQTNFSAPIERGGSAFDQPSSYFGTDEVATRRPRVEENRDSSLSPPTRRPRVEENRDSSLSPPTGVSSLARVGALSLARKRGDKHVNACAENIISRAFVQRKAVWTVAVRV